MHIAYFKKTSKVDGSTRKFAFLPKACSKGGGFGIFFVL